MATITGDMVKAIVTKGMVSQARDHVYAVYRLSNKKEVAASIAAMVDEQVVADALACEVDIFLNALAENFDFWMCPGRHVLQQQLSRSLLFALGCKEGLVLAVVKAEKRGQEAQGA